jgi:hypothetical protein
MIKFKIDEKEYVVPEYITIDHYSKIYKFKDLFDDEYFAARLINIVTNAPMDDLLQSDYQEINYIASYIISLIPVDKPKFKNRFELDGVHYGFFKRWQDLTFAEFVDMDTISSKKPDELLDMIHILAAVMYRPITEERSEHDFDIEKYDVKTMVKRAELFKKKLDVGYVLGAQFFFINFAKRYSLYIQTSLIPNFSIWMKMKLYWKLRKIIWMVAFRKNLDGLPSSTELLQTILQSTTRSIKKQ